jgi:ankyrin repeat protein
MKTLTFIFSLCLLLLAGTAQATPNELHNAAKRGDLEMVQQLLGTRIMLNAINDADDTGFTAVMYAAKVGDSTILKLLIDNGADVNSQNIAGATALMLASKYGHLNAVKKLIAAGANPYLKTNNKYTAQNLASMYGHDDVVDYLKNVRYSAKKAAKS